MGLRSIRGAETRSAPGKPAKKGGRAAKSGNEGARDRSWRVTHHMGEKPAKGDLVIARIAARQHGVVSTAQLRAARIGHQGIYRRSKAGRLHRLHRGVYAVGHTRLTFEGRCMAAVLALGEGSVVSHSSAAALWRLLPPHNGPIEVTLQGRRVRRRSLRIHRSSTLIAGVTTRRDGIAVTNPARTLRDLHRTVPRSMYQRAVRRALDQRLISSSQLRSEEQLTRSELERLFLHLCRCHHLPRPEVNAHVGPYEVDFLWRDRGLIVETDGFRHHADRSSFERDRAQDAHLQSLGFRVLRFTHRQLSDDRSAVVAALRALLGQRSLAPNL
jgi:very-short-patch-repair endonuclease